jgi:hypothetical protein
MHRNEQYITIALLAAFADSHKTEAEREKIRRIMGSLFAATGMAFSFASP